MKEYKAFIIGIILATILGVLVGIARKKIKKELNILQAN